MSQEKQIIKLLLEWHKKNRRKFPWRDESDPYKIVVAEFFLQRTPAHRVAEVYPVFIKMYPSPIDLANADVSFLEEEYRSLGLIKRFSWLVESMKIVNELYDGKIPDSKNLLLQFPGIGEYTASAILCFAFNKPNVIVDANIIRVYTRIFSLSKSEIIDIAQNMLPRISFVSYNESLLDFAALICRNKPRCTNCIINKLCNYYERN